MHIGLLILCGFLIGFILIFLGMGAALYIGCLITIFHLSAKTAAASAPRIDHWDIDQSSNPYD